MFHQEKFPSFHSRSSFVQDLQDRPVTDDDRANRLTLWRDSLTPALEKELGPGMADSLKARKSELRKLSYLPTRLSKLEGIEKFFASAPTGKILVPTMFKSSVKSRGKIFYLIPRNVVLFYGPYYYLGMLDYRTERLHGLQTALKFAGANVILRPSNHINHVSIWYLEKEIFTCRMTDLHHGGDGELDRTCYDAAVAFSTQSKKAMLHVRHRYPFDKHKANLLIRKCPCHEDYQPNVFMDDDDFITEEEEDLEDEDDDDSFYYIDPYSKTISGKSTATVRASTVITNSGGSHVLHDAKTGGEMRGRINRIQIVRNAKQEEESAEAPAIASSLLEAPRKSLKALKGGKTSIIEPPVPTDEDARRELIQASKAAMSKYIPKVR